MTDPVHRLLIKIGDKFEVSASGAGVFAVTFMAIVYAGGKVAGWW